MSDVPTRLCPPRSRRAIAACSALLVLLLAACGGSSEEPTTPGSALSGTIEVDGSSTVFPITEAVAEEFQKLHPGVQINVGVSGTGGGFKRFTTGEVDIADASRPITESEAKAAGEHGVQYHEVPVAIDGLAVLVNQVNRFADCLTIEQLKRVWEPGSQVERWNQVRPDWPDTPIRLYGPGTDSGTFDYFTEVINGKAKASRPDYTASEDDNVLVRGIAGDRNSLGYFGYAYYVENSKILKAVAVDGGAGCASPSKETIESGAYPLARPLFIYVNAKSIQRIAVKEFVKFYLEHADELVTEVGYVPLSPSAYAEQLAKLQ
ncbi:MAG: PstS family phosphate ABC transporter substrate-binding protein [Dehalococcoidia bacterium]|nr:PstS family phosphate ABC transporter substrate-binding protein [Dehalococcoidia bacterium]